MTKKDNKPKLGTDPLAWIKETIAEPQEPAAETAPAPEGKENAEQPALTATKKNRVGRPTIIERKIDKTSQANLRENWTRATFIVQEDLLATLKDLAYTERKTITDVINEAIEQYTKGKVIIRREPNS